MSTKPSCHMTEDKMLPDSGEPRAILLFDVGGGFNETTANPEVELNLSQVFLRENCFYSL